MEHQNKNNNTIDSLLRERLRDAALPPPPFVWTNVERALHRRKRRFFLWFLAAGLAGAGIWSVWTLALKPAAPAPLAVAIPNAARAEKSADVPAPEKTKMIQAGVPQEKQHIPAEPAPDGIKHAVAPVYSKRMQAKGGDLLKIPAAVPAVREDDKAPLPLGAGQLPAAPNGSTANAATKPGLPESGTGANLGAVTDPEPGIEGLLQPVPIALSMLEGTPRQPDLNPVQIKQIKRKSSKKCYDFHANRQAWLMDIYAGPSLVQKNLDSPNPEFTDYIQDRRATEKPEFAFNAGFRASYLFAENFLIRTGLHYDQFTEKFEYIDPKFIKYTVVITNQYINGQWRSVPDTVNIEYGANYTKTYNRFGLLDIPLQAALELRNGPTGLSLNLGGSLNVLFWKRGSMLEPGGKPVSFTPRKNKYDVFQPQVGLSLLGSIQWFYHLSPNLRVFAEPYYRHILQPVTKAGYPVRQSYGIGGIRFGVTGILDSGQ